MSEQKPEEQPAVEKAETSTKIGSKIWAEIRETLEWIGSPQGLRTSIVAGIVTPFTLAGVFTVFGHLKNDIGPLMEETRIYGDCTAVSTPGHLTRELYKSAYYNFNDQKVAYYFNMLAEKQVVNFSDLTPLARTKAREVAEKLPLECKYQKKFEL